MGSSKGVAIIQNVGILNRFKRLIIQRLPNMPLVMTGFEVLVVITTVWDTYRVGSTSGVVGTLSAIMTDFSKTKKGYSI